MSQFGCSESNAVVVGCWVSSCCRCLGCEEWKYRHININARHENNFISWKWGFINLTPLKEKHICDKNANFILLAATWLLESPWKAFFSKASIKRFARLLHRRKLLKVVNETRPLKRWYYSRKVELVVRGIKEEKETERNKRGKNNKQARKQSL